MKDRIFRAFQPFFPSWRFFDFPNEVDTAQSQECRQLSTSNVEGAFQRPIFCSTSLPTRRWRDLFFYPEGIEAHWKASQRWK